MTEPLLSIRDLTVRVGKHPEAPSILDRVSLDLMPGETLGLVGESGSGKSTLGMSVLRLNSPRLAAGTTGQILWQGRDVQKMSARQLRRIRGEEISMILQDPMASLNPVQSIGVQLREALRRSGKRNLSAAAEAALAEVNIPSPADRLRAYPHQMSGGMRQRIVSAIGLAQDPNLLICDEPTTALDATIQYQFLELLAALRAAHDMAMLFITHDFGVVARICDRVAVMYAGRIVETGPVAEIFARPAHPYTRALLASVPSTRHAPRRLPVIEGQPPAVGNRPRGCPFHPRCAAATDQCQSVPPRAEIRPGHVLDCWHPQEIAHDPA
ncbi:peptide/nickel transport system ATP-binding protein [Pseudooceanicola antarcticus]|uniref:ABC transporter ATP-binding protein n=1 Tax=Pseudooceanicola antarcticus TaxID=1247613 RepID=A0A285JG34_9RHOB|nr:ABC transporter ATP-binding protein [Pseudooceanicola antarcticus]PJE26370.1 ABC transporter ATP-binding protein [Pseudooceanicola antarcticus]SNY59238.1 peptide/nickel transport system ATP-binding protein [Pseudooceanicola antarcticus]